jgi:hypothetical protein
MAAERLVVQLPVSESTDFDSLIDLENALTLSFLKDKAAAVDGHEIGQGWFNVFIVPRAAPEPIVDRVKALLAQMGVLDNARIARRADPQERYAVIWPDNFRGTFDPGSGVTDEASQKTRPR